MSAPAPGTSLGPYEILSPLGKGGMGEVYRAKDTRLHRDVAIKVLPASVAASTERLQRFEREATTVAALNHPNIVTIYAIERTEEHHFIAMELVEGETLDRKIPAGGLSLAAIFDVAIPLADALAAAHDKGIIHRDLKPGNVMVTSEGRVKVLDFGLAKLSGELAGGASSNDVTVSAPLTGRGMVIGTVPYMSPEQLQGEPVDHRTDLFSLGIMLYEMATGQRPFRGKNSATITSSILRDAPRPVQELNSVLPRHLGRIVEHCLEKDAEHRYQSAKDVRNELRALRKEVDSGSELSEPVSVATVVSDVLPATPSTASSGSALSAPTRRGEFWIGVAVIGVILIAGFWFMRSRDHSSTTPPQTNRSQQALAIDSIAVVPLENLSGDPEQNYFADGMTEALISELAKISALRVISRTSVMQYRNTDKTLPQIARELSVDAIVEGSVLRIGNRVRITAQLIEAASDRHLWAENYEREMDDVLGLQADLARAIAEQVHVKVTPTEQTRLASAPQVNPAAYDLYVRGMELVRERTRESSQAAIALFEQALLIDSQFALAHVGRGEAYAILDTAHMNPAKTLPARREAAERALEIDANLAEAHIAMGNYRMQHDWDWEGARADYERALELSPNLAGARLAYALYLTAMKRTDEAMTQLNIVRELNPAAIYSNADFGAVSYMSRRFEQTIEDCTEALQVNPGFDAAHSWIGMALAARGQYEDGISHLRRAWELTKSPADAAVLGGALASAGHDDEARSIRRHLKERKEIEYVCPYEVATISIGLNEFEQALEEISEACDDRAACIPWLQVDPRLDPIRDDARFDDLLRRVGFEPSDGGLRVAGELDKEPISLAILPFENSSAAEEASYLADEIPASIISRLSQMSGLRVVPRSTVFHLRNEQLSPAEVGHRLDVRMLLTGQVALRGEQLIVRAELIDLESDSQVWGERFIKTAEQLLTVEEEMAQRISDALKLTLTGDERGRLTKRYTESSEAYREYLQGRFWWSKRSKVGFEKAIQHFRNAVDNDPSYALALAGLADTHALRGVYQLVAPNEAMREARIAAQAALRADELLAEAHVSMGGVQVFYDWDWESAVASFLRALELNPNYATAYHWGAYVHSGRGDLHATLNWLERAHRIDPSSLIIMTDVGRMYRMAGRYADAERVFDRARKIDPSFGRIERERSLLYMETGSPQVSVEILEAAHKSSKWSGFLAAPLGGAYGLVGETTKARRLITSAEQLEREQYVSPMVYAAIYAGLGETDRAFEFLLRAYELRDPLTFRFSLFPSLEQMQSEPRVDDLMRRAGFTPLRTPPRLMRKQPDKIMLAVLPFENLSRDPEQEYFSDGMTEEMITRLGRLSPARLGVIARTSSMRFKGAAKGIGEIGQELGVGFVVEGSIRRDADRVRITAKLIQVSDQTQVWSDSYDRDLSDVFKIQADVADAIAESLAVELLPDRQGYAAKAPTESSAAYDAYLLGRHYWAKRTPDALRTAIDHFQRAIDLDPDFALAYAGLADAWGVLPWYAPGPYVQMYVEATKAAQQALALDDSLAEAHVSIGNLFAERGKWTSAEPHFQEALTLDPNNATAHQWYGLLLAFQGRRGAAIPELEHAISLDPLSAVMREDYCYALVTARRFEEGIEQCNRAIELNPDSFHGVGTLAWAYVGKGDLAAAATWFERYFRLLQVSETSLTAFRRTCQTQGLRAGMLELLDSADNDEGLSGRGPGVCAALYAWCGETDEAFKWLERALANQDPYLLLLSSHRAFESLRDDPRYASLLQRFRAESNGNPSSQR